MDYIPRYKILTEAKYSFILSSFGLQNVSPLLFKPSKSNVRDWNEAEYKSALGTPVWDNLILQDSLNNPTIKLRIDVVLFDLSQPKIIKKTQVTGRSGKIKEYIAEDDWNILIRGAFFSTNKDDYPEEEIRTLKKLKAINKEIVAVSRYLQMLDISDIVIENLIFKQREGGIQSQAFELKCSSELPFELKYEES